MRMMPVLLAATLVSCATMSDVMQIGPGTYMVSTTVRGGMSTDTEVKSSVIRKAQAHCGGMGKQMEMISSTNAGLQGWSPQTAEVTFKCV